MLFIFSSTQRINIDTYIILYRNPSKAFKSLTFPGGNLPVVHFHINFHIFPWWILEDSHPFLYQKTRPIGWSSTSISSKSNWPLGVWPWTIGAPPSRPVPWCHGHWWSSRRIPGWSDRGVLKEDMVGKCWENIWFSYNFIYGTFHFFHGGLMGSRQRKGS